MSAAAPGVDLVFVWHHHQPDYRHPRDGRALLPWVRLHASKDYLDMALHLERHPRVKATFNFAPSLLEQLDGALAGGRDALFDLLEQPPGALSAEDRAELQARCRVAPRWALERWPRYRALRERLRPAAPASDAELLALSCFFLLAWLDPVLLEEPESAALEAAVAGGSAGELERAALLARHADALARVRPAYATLAERGQIEISCSPAFHPILPLLIDVRTARRSRPDLPSPVEPFAAPEDARRQIERGLARAEAAFGRRPRGMWPSEGSVSPEAAELLAAAGVQWIATDELVLWRSLGPTRTRRELLYRPWRYATASGEITLLFRDHELSDKIGFVYATWAPEQAVADFLHALRRIAAAHQAAGLPGRPAVAVILDGENCWETYADDGRPFLEALYGALERAPDVRTCTPSELLAGESGRLEFLHSGSWIDADFHIWAGHPEKNRAWDLLARTRAELVRGERTIASHGAAWEALDSAEGSDWFWWFGDDHFTADKELFDSLFRAHLQAVHERAGLPVPSWIALPIVGHAGPVAGHTEPTGLIRPTLDGHLSRYYEWHGAGLWRLDGGGAMHRVSEPLALALHYGFDERALFLRLDFATAEAPGPQWALELEVILPRPVRLRLESLARGERPLVRLEGEPAGDPGRAAIGSILELEVPFEALGARADQTVDVLVHLERAGQRIETLPPGRTLRVTAPGPDWEARHWSA